MLEHFGPFIFCAKAFEPELLSGPDGEITVVHKVKHELHFSVTLYSDSSSVDILQIISRYSVACQQCQLIFNKSVC